MQIASVTLTSNREDIIGDALRSVVDFVDFCLIVDLGITDGTLDVAREVAGGKLRVVKLDEPEAFADARNFGMEEAHRLGADWACSLDTDERIHLNGVDIRKALDEIGSGVVLAPHDSGMYCKERFLKLPLVDRFSSKCHECIVPQDAPQTFFDNICFSELQKSGETLKKKLSEVVSHMNTQIEQEPYNPRWWYYLGDAQHGLGMVDEALHSFEKCAEMDGWDEESAWSCFRASTILGNKGENRRALDLCLAGLVRHPGIAELSWYAGEVCLGMGHPDKAIYWARMAAANGITDGEEHFIRPRIGFRFPFGAKEGPHDLMVRAYTVMGMAKEAADAALVRDRISGVANACA